MNPLLLILWALLGPALPAGPLPEATFAEAGRTACLVPEGLITAELRWAGLTVTAREGALQIGDRRFTACDALPDPFPTALATFEGALYVGFRAAGVHRYAHGRFHRVTGLPVDGVRALAATSERLWIGLGTRGLFFTGDDGRARRYPHWILGRRGITGLAAQGGRLEVGVGPYGWWRIEGAEPSRVARSVFAGCFGEEGPLAPVTGCALSTAEVASGLPSGHVTALARHQGALYVGTFDEGLARQTATGFEAVSGAPRFVNALLSDGTTLWIASPRGLYRLDHRGVRAAGLPLPSRHVNGLGLGRDGALWVATSRGLAGFGQGGIRRYDRSNGLPGRIVYAVAITDDGAVWAGTDRGAVRIGADGVTAFTQANGGVPHDWINALLADGEQVYAGTYDAGVVRLTRDGRGQAVPGLESAWVNPAGLAFVSSRLTVATLGDGFLSVDARSVGAPLRRAGLPSADVTASLVHDGKLYIGTRGGLARVDAP